MKKIFTLFAGLLVAAAVFAEAPRPALMLQNYRNFRVVIDGQVYTQSQARIVLDDHFFRDRMHTVSVYEFRRGFFSRYRMVDTRNFNLDRNDVMLIIDPFGQIRIQEMNNRRDDRDDRWKKEKRKKRNGRYDDDDDHNRY